MPVIFLKQAFMKHYPGTIMHLPEATEQMNWHEDERVREKLPFFDKRTYPLPDAGNGRPAELPVSETEILPEHWVSEASSCSGPCRITSLTKLFSSDNQKSPDIYPIPYGAPPVTLHQNAEGILNIVTIELQSHQCPFKIEITNRLNFKNVLFTETRLPLINLDFADYPLGFYRLYIKCFNHDTIIVNFIKLYPYYVVIETASLNNYRLEKTIW